MGALPGTGRAGGVSAASAPADDVTVPPPVDALDDVIFAWFRDLFGVEVPPHIERIMRGPLFDPVREWAPESVWFGPLSVTVLLWLHRRRVRKAAKSPVQPAQKGGGK